jgi:hypothetical protein
MARECHHPHGAHSARRSMELDASVSRRVSGCDPSLSEEPQMNNRSGNFTKPVVGRDVESGSVLTIGVAPRRRSLRASEECAILLPRSSHHLDGKSSRSGSGRRSAPYSASASVDDSQIRAGHSPIVSGVLWNRDVQMVPARILPRARRSRSRRHVTYDHRGASSNGSARSSFPYIPDSHLWGRSVLSSMVVACAPIGDRRRARVPAHRVAGRSFAGAAR